MRRPKIQTPLPGPQSTVLAERGEACALYEATPHSLFVRGGSGCWLEDVDGNELLDMSAAMATCSTGYCHPAVVEVVQAQSKLLLQAAGYCSTGQPELSERLAKLEPVRGQGQVHLTGSGAEAVEAAIRLARYHTGRQAIIPFLAPTDSLAADATGASDAIHRNGISPLFSGLFHSTFPDPLRDGEEATIAALEQLGSVLGKVVAPDLVAAILIEPIHEQAGFVIPPEQFLHALRRLCDQYGILLIFDERQTGMGRTGKMFCWQHSGVEPDILCLAHGLASGLPLGATVVTADLALGAVGEIAGSLRPNPLACAAALCGLDLLEESLVANAADLGAQLLDKLQAALGKHPRVAAVRGCGLVVAVELVEEGDGLKRDGALRDELTKGCLEEGLVLRSCGPNCLGFTPALTLAPDEASVAVEILAEVLKAKS